jgi:hypothetical protein
VRRGRPAESEVALAVEYMAMQRPLKHPRWGSYGLKHWVETWAGEYIANGAVIVAALQMGLPVEACGGDNPNCRIGLKLRTKPGDRRKFGGTVPDGCHEKREDGRMAQDRMYLVCTKARWPNEDMVYAVEA